MELIENFNNALQALYDHVGFIEDWTVYSVDDRSGMYWKVLEDSIVRYSETLEKLNSEDQYYENEIYKQRFYHKHIYRGDELTMIIVDTHIDGNKFFAFYENSLEAK